MSEKHYVPEELKRVVDFLWQKESLTKEETKYVYYLIKYTVAYSFDDTYRWPEQRPAHELIQKAAHYIVSNIDKIKDSELRGIETSKLKDIDYVLNLDDPTIICINNDVEDRVKYHK